MNWLTVIFIYFYFFRQGLCSLGWPQQPSVAAIHLDSSFCFLSAGIYKQHTQFQWYFLALDAQQSRLRSYLQVWGVSQWKVLVWHVWHLWFNPQKSTNNKEQENPHKVKANYFSNTNALANASFLLQLQLVWSSTRNRSFQPLPCSQGSPTAPNSSSCIRWDNNSQSAIVETKWHSFRKPWST